MNNWGLSFYTRYQRESQNQTRIVVVTDGAQRDYMWKLCDVTISRKSNMAAKTGSRNEIKQYLSLYIRYQHNSKGGAHIYGVQQHGSANVDTFPHRGEWWIKQVQLDKQRNISVSTLDSNEFPKDTSHFEVR